MERCSGGARQSHRVKRYVGRHAAFTGPPLRAVFKCVLYLFVFIGRENELL